MIKITNENFRRAMSIAVKASERRRTIPVTSTLRCRANGRFEVTGTDLDNYVSASVTMTDQACAEFCIMSPREVSASLARGGGKGVEIDVDDGRAIIESGNVSLKVGTLPALDFPANIDRPLDKCFSATLSAEHIRALGRVSCAISTEPTRYYLNGINIKPLESGMFRVAATNGHLLCFTDIALPDAAGDIGDIIIPTKAVRLLRELASKAPGDIKLEIGALSPTNRLDGTAPASSNATHLGISFEDDGAVINIRSKLIDGTFPDYSRVIPTGNDKPMLFQTTELRRALRAVSGHSRNVRALRIVLGNGTAAISARYVDLGIDAAAIVACQHSHTGFEIGFNGRYLSDMLDAAQGDEIVLTAADMSATVLVRNPADTEWGGVLMPLRSEIQS